MLLISSGPVGECLDTVAGQGVIVGCVCWGLALGGLGLSFRDRTRWRTPLIVVVLAVVSGVIYDLGVSDAQMREQVMRHDDGSVTRFMTFGNSEPDDLGD